MHLLEITDKNFKEEVLKSELPVLVDLWAPWCGPCRMLAPVLEELAQEYHSKLKIVKVNVDENRGVPTQYGIMSIPTLIFFKNGKVVEQAVGVLGRHQLKQKIDQLIK